MSGVQLSWERERWVVRYQSSWLKQQANNERVKPLITYRDGINNSLKLEKMPSKCVPFFSTEGWTGQGSDGSAQMWGPSHCWGSPEQKALAVLWAPRWEWVGWRWEERARSGKVLNTESEWRKVSSRFPSLLPQKEASVEAPEVDFCPRTQIKRPRNEGTGARNINMWNSVTSHGAWGFGCNSLQRLKCIECTKSWCGEGSFAPLRLVR